MTSLGVGVGVGLRHEVDGSGGGGGGGEIDGETIPTLISYYDSSETSLITQPVGLVSSMLDKFGSNNLFTPNMSQRPTSGASTMNGLNILDCSPNDRLFLVNPTNIPVFDGNDLCLSMVVRHTDMTADTIFQFNSLGALRMDGWVFDGGIGNHNAGHPISAGDQILTIHITDTETNYYKNGALISTVGFSDESLLVVNYFSYASNNINGSIASVVLWRDPADIPTVVNLQKLKWGIA